MAVVRVSDVVVPAVFTGYAQQISMEKSALLASGSVVMDPVLSGNLSGGGLTFNEPSFKDLTNNAENISSDDPAVFSTPDNVGSATEIQVRLSRNKSWSSMDLTGDLIARDPMDAIAQRVGNYWALRYQALFVATMAGVFADNDAAPTGNDTHTINDLKVDVKGGAYVAGVTNFTAENFIDATLTMGDAMGNLSLICVHSVVYGRMQKNNLIDFIPDAQGVINIPTFLGRRVVVDDGLPATAGVFESWLFGSGAFRMGVGSAKMPTEVEREPSAGNGSGQEILYSRQELCLHPVGHAYIGTAPNGGPSNAATANNLAAAGSWSRVWAQRKMIKIARLITREY